MSELKKYKIPEYVLGPLVQYSNTIRAHSPREAAEIYIAQTGEKPTEHSITGYAEMMVEHGPSQPITKYYDSLLEEMHVGDEVFALTGVDGGKTGYRRGTVKELMEKSMKVSFDDRDRSFAPLREDQHYVDGEMVPFFGKLIKVKKDMNLDGPISVGNVVAGIRRIDYGSTGSGLMIGKVLRIKNSWVFIEDFKEGEIRREMHKVLKLYEKEKKHLAALQACAKAELYR